ncbi:grpE protein homolog 2, mitochondrial-like isoform X1 [Cornus florida]|uniref:grpE protein homolog 2, mitochondrial-like isoform X1 n=1 Tax=Cornus florida TaxID=4283 RepID=UPI00289FAD03|nr:grpE protein homolog 2, mitochondrial-like isoform X1 [Cornus florida]
MMLFSRVSSRLSRSVLAQSRNSLLFSARHQHHHIPIPSNQFHLLSDSQNKLITGKVSLLHHSIPSTFGFQRFRISSSATEEENAKSSGDTEVVDQTQASASGQEKTPDQKEESGSNSESLSNMPNFGTRRRVTKRTAFSDSDSSDSDEDLSIEDLVKLVAEKEELLKLKHKEIENMQDKVLRSYAEAENVMERTRREAENSKKFAIQNFAKSLLDVADNLGRASSLVKESFSKIDASKDTSGAVPLLKTLLEGVEMTEKQLAGVFKKFGVEKFDPTNEQFDPNSHNAVFQVPDASKPPGTVAVVLKAGYMLYDRVIRPAEVGVTVELEKDNKEEGQGSEA